MNNNKSINTKLIPSSGGVNKNNGLPIQNTACVLYSNVDLKIMGIYSTYNRAEEASCDAYNKNPRTDPLTYGLRYCPDTINAKDIIGRYMNEFEDFVSDNPSHPLCKISIAS